LSWLLYDPTTDERTGDIACDNPTIHGPLHVHTICDESWGHTPTRELAYTCCCNFG
jgi:hypothetical protein